MNPCSKSGQPLKIAIALGVVSGVSLLALLMGVSPQFIEIGVILVAATYPTFWLAKRLFAAANRVDPFSPYIAFPIAYVLWFGIGSAQLVDAPPGFSFGLLEPVPAYVLGYAGLGLMAYFAGAMLFAPGCPSFSPTEIVDVWSKGKLQAVCFGLLVLMVLSYGYIVADIGIPVLDPMAGEVRLDIQKHGPMEAVLLTASWTVAILALVYVWRYKPRPIVRILYYAVASVSAVLLLSLGGRGYLFVPLLTVLVARNYLKRRFVLSRMPIILVVVFCAMSGFGYLRDTSLSGDSSSLGELNIPGSILPEAYAYLYIRYSVATLRDVMHEIPRKIPFQSGELTFKPLTTLLPGHHEQSDMFFKNMLGNDFIGAGQPATLLGPLYADAGPFGIVLALFLFGGLVSRAYGWMNAAPTTFRVFLYAWIMQTALFSLFANLFPYFTTLWIPAFWSALHVLMTKPTPRIAET